MAKVTISSILSSFASITKLNANFTAIASALENTLSRDGTSPNQMQAVLDMNSNRIINLPTPSGGADAATKTYVDTVLSDVTTDEISVSTGITVVDTRASLTALSSPGGLYITRGASSVGDGLGSAYLFISGSTTTADGSSVITHTLGRFKSTTIAPKFLFYVPTSGLPT